MMHINASTDNHSNLARHQPPSPSAQAYFAAINEFQGQGGIPHMATNSALGVAPSCHSLSSLSNDSGMMTTSSSFSSLERPEKKMVVSFKNDVMMSTGVEVKKLPLKSPNIPRISTFNEDSYEDTPPSPIQGVLHQILRSSRIRSLASIVILYITFFVMTSLHMPNPFMTGAAMLVASTIFFAAISWIQVQVYLFHRLFLNSPFNIG